MCYLRGISDPFEMKFDLKQNIIPVRGRHRYYIFKKYGIHRFRLSSIQALVMMDEIKEEVIINLTLKFINASKEMGLHVYEGKNKYVIILRKSPNIDSIRGDDYKFKKIDEFKYLDVSINSINDMYIEIK